jgi:DNA polymerase elongation subunit (family B)
MKIKSIKRTPYKGKIYDVTLKNNLNPYFYVNGILTHNSLYPHVFAQCNLFSPSETIGWHGGNIFETNGIYNDKEMGKIEKLLMEFYQLRQEYKRKKDAREYSIKIIINTFYGLTGNVRFKHLYNPIGASDCTYLGRQWVMLARKRFREAGYEILYTDTDSWYIRDPFNNKEKMIQIKNDLIKEIKDNVPFPQDTFDAGIDDEISHMWFFKSSANHHKDIDEFVDEDDIINKEKGFMKKNYIYLTKDNRIVYKNLGVKKKSASELSRVIFRDIIIPKIKKEKCVKWNKQWFEKTINELLNENLMLVATRYQVKDWRVYKNESQLQSQISKKYGSGIHFLIKNTKIGVGKGSKYCSIDEFNKNNLTINDIDMSNVWSELEYFIIEDIKQNNKNKLTLSEWGF